MREFIDLMFRFPWVMSRGMMDLMLSALPMGNLQPGSMSRPGSTSMYPLTGQSMTPYTPPEAPPVEFGGLITSTENMKTDGPESLHIRLDNTTQGPFWPPAAQVNENGDFILVGTVLTEIKPGMIIPVPRQAVLVSKDTVPPLDANGREDFSNLFGAPYEVIRPLDLSPGSPDLDMVVYSVSWGPHAGDWGGVVPGCRGWARAGTI